VTAKHPESALRIVRECVPDVHPSTNWLLAALPPTVLAHMTPHLERVTLNRKQTLFRAYERLGHVYFPATAIVSLVVGLDSGETLDVGMTGREGLAGALASPDISSMPCDAVVQFGGIAFRMDAGLFRQSLRNFEPLAAAVRGYAHLLLVRSMQMQVCAVFHPVEQQLTRWLLTLSDLLMSTDIRLTHELLATMLGVRRPTITLVLGQLQRAGLVEEKRGRVVIRDRERLEAACCPCYRVMCEQQAEILRYLCAGAAMSF
jgi:CRP-like cAMP-binding protein